MLLSLLLSFAAHADALPKWSWSASQPLRFHLETELVVPRGQRYYSSINLDARAGGVKIRADFACTPKPLGKGQLVACTFAYIDVKALALSPDEQAKLDKIMAEWTTDLSNASVELVMNPDGRLRAFDVTPGKEQSDHREGFKLEQQAVLLQRVFCIFDLPLTVDDDAWVRGWPQKGDTAIMRLPTASGTAGAVEMKHSYTGQRDGYTLIQTVARGTLSSGAAVDASSGGRLVDVRMAGETLFDASSGMIAWRDFTLDGQLMVSAQEAGSSAEFFQTAAIQRVQEFPAPGDVPLTIAAQKAPKLAGAAPVLAEGLTLAPFAELGMQALFIAGMPDAAKPLSLPKTVVVARVFVAADGLPTTVKAFQGYAVLGGPTEEALAAARFPVRSAAYAVDVEVEWRP